MGSNVTATTIQAGHPTGHPTRVQPGAVVRVAAGAKVWSALGKGAPLTDQGALS